MNCSNSLSLDQFLCADEKHERTVGRSQHTVNLVDADVTVLCRLLGGQCHFQMDRNGAGTICHVKTPFLGLSAEQTSRRFQIVGSGAFAEAVTAKHDGDADLQDAVINAAVIQIGSLLQNGKRNIRGDDMGLPVSSRLSTTSNTRSLPKLVLRSAPKSSRMRRSGRISDFM